MKGRLSRTLLRMAVHVEALITHPASYAKASWWRLCGKRMRSRLIMAPLLGQTRLAYRLWLASPSVTSDLASTKRDKSAILALVAAGDGADATIASLQSEGIQAQFVNETLQCSAEWILALKAGDTLAVGAGAAYARAVARADADTRIIYADDDLLSPSGQRYSPHFKPDWNSELFAHCDFISGAALLRIAADDLAEITGQDIHGPDWVETLTRRVVEGCARKQDAVDHLRQILVHRCARPEPRPLVALAEPASPALPSISVIIPTRNGLNLLRTCLEGLSRTSYPHRLEILVIDNGSDDPDTLDYLARLDPEFAQVLRDDGPFNFAALNNRAVEHVSGDLLCFLNNDIEIGAADWLEIMARQALRTDVGAVGARLLYPDGRIQHAGVVLGVGGGAAHAHRFLSPEEKGYFHRHSLPQFTSAVTAACMVVERDKFLAIGGFDAAHFAVSFNDVDLCMRLAERGWQSLYEPRATLVHHESVSRGFDRDPTGAARLAGELAELQKRWIGRLGEKDGLPVDPYHHPALSRFSETFVLDV